MRKADIDLARKECRVSNRRRLQLDSVSIKHGTISDDLVITSRITALVGPNGAGKTRLLKGVFDTLTGNIDLLPKSPKLELKGIFNGQCFTVDSLSRTIPEDLTVEYVDVSLEAHAILRYLMTQSNLNEVLAQFEQKVCYGTELDLYRYICQRNYSKVLVRELEFPSESESIGDGTENLEEKVFPFFEIEIDEISYDAKAMGFGEFCACYLVWKIFRSNKGSILLFDEPDSHLSPLSRLSLSNAMALVAKERELWICFSTHSIEMLEELIEDEIFIVSSDVSQWLPRVPPASGRRRAMITLGLAQQRCLLIVVEDVDSVEVVWSMVNRWGSEIAKCLDVQIIPDGAENVLRFVAEFPCDARICRVIAALDGDERIYGDARAPGRIFYLPSDYDPILAAKTFVEHDCRSFANLLGVDPDELRKSLRRIAYVNHHDFLRELLDRQQFGGRTVSSLRTALINEWLSDEAVSSDARDFVQNILIQQIDQISRPIETLP